MGNKTKKIFVIFGAIFFIAAPFYAQAQITDITALLDAPILAAIKAAEVANQACAANELAFGVGDTATQFAFGGLGLISGGTAVTAQLKAKIGKIDGFISCREAVETTLTGITPIDAFTATSKQTVYNSASTAINSLKTKKETLQGQLTVATEGFWKSIVIEVLVQTTKSVASTLLSHLVNNYAIKDFSKYTDAVATLVYDNEYIQNNFSGNNADQLLVRSFLTNPAIDQSLSPAIVQRSQEALGFSAATLSPSDPNFYTKMAQVGGISANPYAQQAIMADQAATIHQQALASAQNEVVQSNGLKTPRNCPGVYAQQQALDQSYTAVNTQLQNRQQLLSSLLAAQAAGKTVNPSDIQKAQADVAAAQTAWDKLPYDVNTPSGNAAIDICTAIVSPPSLINKGINDALTSIDQNLGVYNSNNLPFFISFIGQVGSQIANSLIFGGNQSAATIINEDKSNLTAAAGLGAAYGLSATQNSSSSPIFIASRSDDGSNPKSSTYGLQWDVTNISGAQGVIITGPGLDKTINNAPLYYTNNTVPATLPIPGTYTFTITVFGASTADIKATSKLVIIAGQASAQVAGASATRPLYPVRGEPASPTGSVVQTSAAMAAPATPISPRG